MEMMESIAMPDMVIEKSDPCWYCEEQPVAKEENKEDEEPPSPEGKAEEGVAENSETNNASKLGIALALGSLPPSWSVTHKLDSEDPVEHGVSTAIVPAAHHLLPGNASVKKAAQLHKYMRWQKNNDLGLSGPIGYDINSKANGVWLPGNYAVRKETAFEKNWSAFNDPFKNAYARAAMTKAGNMQFHDAHKQYNDNVRETLLDVAKALDAKWVTRDKCPICKKTLEDQARPPYGLVSRLNRLSAEHKKPLVSPKDNRPAIQNGYFTSSRVTKVFL